MDKSDNFFKIIHCRNSIVQISRLVLSVNRVMKQPLDKLHHLIINSTNAGHFNDTLFV